MTGKTKAKAKAPPVIARIEIAFTARGALPERIERLDRLAGARGLSRWEYVDRLVQLHEELLIATRENKKYEALELLTKIGLGPVHA